MQNRRKNICLENKRCSKVFLCSIYNTLIKFRFKYHFQKFVKTSDMLLFFLLEEKTTIDGKSFILIFDQVCRLLIASWRSLLAFKQFGTPLLFTTKFDFTF